MAYGEEGVWIDRRDLSSDEWRLLVERTAEKNQSLQQTALEAIRLALHPPTMVVPGVTLDEFVQKKMRYGCPKGHNSAYTVYGQHSHSCSACGRTHTWTDKPEDPLLFGATTTVAGSDAQE